LAWCDRLKEDVDAGARPRHDVKAVDVHGCCYQSPFL
jgi:hypothetical protein